MGSSYYIHKQISLNSLGRKRSPFVFVGDRFVWPTAPAGQVAGGSMRQGEKGMLSATAQAMGPQKKRMYTISEKKGGDPRQRGLMKLNWGQAHVPRRTAGVC